MKHIYHRMPIKKRIKINFFFMKKNKRSFSEQAKINAFYRCNH